MFKSLFYILLIASLGLSGWSADATETTSKKPLKIGLDADMSAVAAEGGVAIKRGASIAIEQINASGGVLGHPLELVVRDHRGNPARGKHNIKKFGKDPDVIAVVGGVHTPVVIQELDLIHQYKLPFLVPWAAGTPIIDNGYEPNFVFRISVRDEQAAEVLLQHAKQKGNKKVALLLEQTGWGRSNEKSMKKAAERHGLEVTQVAWFNWRQPSMLNELKRIRESGATAVMLVANAPEGAVIIKEAIAHNFTDLQFISHWGIAGGAFVESVGMSQLEQVDLSVLQTYSFTKPNNPVINDYVLNEYRKRFDLEATASSMAGAVGVAHAYDLVHALALAITNAKSTARTDIQKSLEQLKGFKGLVKDYDEPFAKSRHDALFADDYMMSKYNSQGYLVPIRND